METAPPSPEAAKRGRIGWFLAAALAVALGAGLFYREAVHPNLFPKNFGVVDEGRVYRSGQLTPAAFRSVVEEHGIRTVIDLGSALNDAGTADDMDVERLNQRAAEAQGVTRYRLSLLGDGTGNPNYYVQALRIMTDPAAQPVLIHCGAGAERTGATAVLYENLVLGVPIEEAYSRAGEFRHRPEKNPNLKKVLDEHGAAIVAAARNGGSVPRAKPLPPPKPVAAPPK